MMIDKYTYCFPAKLRVFTIFHYKHCNLLARVKRCPPNDHKLKISSRLSKIDLMIKWCGKAYIREKTPINSRIYY